MLLQLLCRGRRKSEVLLEQPDQITAGEAGAGLEPALESDWDAGTQPVVVAPVAGGVLLGG